MNHFYTKYPTFDYEFYHNYYPDLHIFCKDKSKLISHYENYGFKEGRIINKSDLNMEEKKKYLLQYFPLLFHKYILNLENFNDSKIKYSLKKKKKDSSYFYLNSKFIVHIHCFKISYLETMFHAYIPLLNSFFKIIVTFYELDNPEIINKASYQKIIFLECTNKGYDIGGKFIVSNFLRDKNYDYNYIFFMHSKSKEEKRKEYLEPFIENIETIKHLLVKGNIGGIFNDIIYCGNQVIYIHNQLVKIDVKNIHWDKNEVYMNELANYFDVIKENYLFSEGNFFILHKKVIDLLYSDSLLYTILNEEKSFDYNWVKKRYDLKETCFKKVFEEYQSRNLFGNNMETKLGWDGYADAMIEHSFERLPLILTNHLNMEIKIVAKKIPKPNNLPIIEKLVNTKINCKSQYLYFDENSK